MKRPKLALATMFSAATALTEVEVESLLCLGFAGLSDAPSAAFAFVCASRDFTPTNFVCPSSGFMVAALDTAHPMAVGRHSGQADRDHCGLEKFWPRAVNSGAGATALRVCSIIWPRVRQRAAVAAPRFSRRLKPQGRRASTPASHSAACRGKSRISAVVSLELFFPVLKRVCS